MVSGRYFGAKSKIAREMVEFLVSYFDTNEYDTVAMLGLMQPTRFLSMEPLPFLDLVADCGQ